MTELREVSPVSTPEPSPPASHRWRRLFRRERLHNGASHNGTHPHWSTLMQAAPAVLAPPVDGDLCGTSIAPSIAPSIATAPPTSESHHQIKLPDGRWLGYAEYGDPDGKPVVSFHGGMSCRLEMRFAARYCAQNGVRLFSIDRPGIGLSSVHAERTLCSWPTDVAHFARTVGLDRFAVLGWSAGGPHALACAHEIPELLTNVGTVGCVAPVDIRPETVPESGLQMDRILYPLVRRSPRTAMVLLRCVRRAPAWLLKRSLLHEVGGCSDRALVAALDTTDFEFFYESFRPGLWGAVHDYRVLAGDWGFRLGDVTKKVHLWQGADDRLLPACQSRWLAERLPGAQMHLLPGEGHFLIRSRLSEILSVLLA